MQLQECLMNSTLKSLKNKLHMITYLPNNNMNVLMNLHSEILKSNKPHLPFNKLLKHLTDVPHRKLEPHKILKLPIINQLKAETSLPQLKTQEEEKLMHLRVQPMFTKQHQELLMKLQLSQKKSGQEKLASSNYPNTLTEC